MKLSFVVIDSRGDKHPDWVQQCYESLGEQFDDDYEVIIVPNRDKTKTIGQCWNEGVKESKGNWVIFIGDDDFVAPDFAKIIRMYAESDAVKNSRIVNIATYMTAFEDSTGKKSALNRQNTGAWKKEYLLRNPFNEKLLKGVDREYVEETVKRGDLCLIIEYYYGYFYRKHNDYSCAGEIIFSKESADYYFVTSNRIFLTPITNRVGKRGSVFIDNMFTPELAKQAKVVWCEWGNEKAIDISNTKLNAKKILRVHAYEAFTDYAKYINWNGFDVVIFIDDYIKEYVEKQYGKVNGAVVIPNGVDLTKFTLAPDKKRNNKIAFAGYLSRKKGIGELLLLAKSLPDYEFHLAGKYQEDDIADWINTKKPGNVFIHEWKYAEAMNEFYQDKSFIFSTSLRESQAMSICEGMACGCKPLVRDWIDAEKVYKPEYVWGNIQDVKRMLEGEWHPSEYRKFIEEKYNFDNVYPRIEELIV